MIDRENDLSISAQAKALGISRGSVYYAPRPVSTGDLALMRRIDEFHLDYPYAANIVLNGRRTWPGTVAEYGPSFAAIAERMLEIVTCIDITDEPRVGNTPNFSGLLESHPNLTGCTIDLTG